jgi:SAM-dependent methyltransferase
MNHDQVRIAAAANLATYDEQGTPKYVAGAPHLTRASTRKLYRRLVEDVVEYAKRQVARPHVLDLGAGEGSATEAFLSFGANVTAVDISANQLEELQRKCAGYRGCLETRCEDIHETLKHSQAVFDVVCMTSLLHHVPDYLDLVQRALPMLRPGGQLFTFQDPLRYDTAGWSNRVFDVVGYMSWRVFQGDLWGGFSRRVRRSRGIYLEDCEKDNTEYHVTRNGVDQAAIQALLETAGYHAKIIRYFSTQGPVVQPIGELLHRVNCFAVIARSGESSAVHCSSPEDTNGECEGASS